MKQYKRQFIAFGICAFVILAGINMMKAGGFLAVRAVGVPYRWNVSVPVPFNPDQGMLGVLANSDAVNRVNQNFELWGTTNIPTSALSFTNAGQLSIDVVTAADYAQFISVNDTISPIIFDVDGSLFDALGIDAIGFAGPEFLSGNAIVEGFVVLNGDYIDGDASDGNEMTVDAFGGVMAHEFGHFLNLAHTQINGHFYPNPGLNRPADTNDPGFQIYQPTFGPPPVSSKVLMFPEFNTSNPEQTTVPLKDDIATISTLYPAGGFPGTFSTIEGHIFENDGMTRFRGANVIARNVVDPYFDTVSWVSGSLHNPATPSSFGAYQLNGLTPGASYTIEVVNISPQFVAGSGIPPLDPPAILPGPEEFWNGASESSNASDDRLDSEVVVATGTVSDIDIILNKGGTLQMDKFDSKTEFILSVQSLITSFETPNGSNDYAAVRYPIPASVDTPFTVARMSFFNNDDQTVWPRVLLATANGSGQPDLANPLAEVNNVRGSAREFITVDFGATRTSFEDLFVVVQFPPGEAISMSGSGGGPAIGADARFEFGYVPGNLYSSDGINFFETNTTAGAGSVDAANWEITLELSSDNLGPDDLEPNNDMGSATAISYGEAKKGSIDPAGELDYFEFTGSAGDTIQADIAAQICGAMLDGFLTLVDSNGDTVAQHDDEFLAFGKDPKLQAVLPATGTYFLIMDSWDNAENNEPVGGPDFFYDLHLNTFSPLNEPNNEVAQATPITADETVEAALDLEGDIDFYSFDAQAGDFLTGQVFLAGVGLIDPNVESSLSPVITLFDTDGTTVLAMEDGSALQTTLPSDGTYFLAVADLNDAGGSDFFYGISITIGLNLRTPIDLTATGGKDRVQLNWQPPQVVETEPNNTSSQIQELTGPSPILVGGNAEVSDDGALGIQFTNGTTDDVEDLFVIRTQSPGLNLTLTGASSDLDLWLFDNPVENILAPERANRGNVGNETINLPGLPAGSYVIGVAIFDLNPVGPTESPYKLTVTGDIPGTGGVLQSFNIYRSESSNPVSSGSVIANVGQNTSTFLDQNLQAQTFFYQITAIYDIGESSPSNEASAVVTSVEGDPSNLPTSYVLDQNYPNPFNPSTVIRYAIPLFHKNEKVKLEVFNMLGQKVRTLVNELLSASFYTVEWDGTNDLGKPVTSGLYLYRIEAGSFVQIRKMIFLK